MILRRNLKMKKFLSMLLCLSLFGCLVACSNGQIKNTDTTSDFSDEENIISQTDTIDKADDLKENSTIQESSNKNQQKPSGDKNQSVDNSSSITKEPSSNKNQPTHTHNYSSSITKEATCGNEGVRTYKCSCGNSYTESISKKSSHNWKNATCTSPKKCYECGMTEGEVKEHNYSTLNNYKCDMCGQVDPIVDGALKNSSLKTPKLPLTVKSYGISECQFNITDIEYEFEYYSNGKVLLKAKFSGIKVYDSKGDSHSSTCEITWKLYDSNGNVVNSGFQYTPSLTTGEKISNIEETLLPHYKASEPGMYRLEILPTNR